MKRPITSSMMATLLKLSGRESNPFEGANLEKNMSGPPSAKTSVWDSRFAAVETINDASSMLFELDWTSIGDNGRRGAYLFNEK
jgi:hypothetical protein